MSEEVQIDDNAKVSDDPALDGFDRANQLPSAESLWNASEAAAEAGDAPDPTIDELVAEAEADAAKQEEPEPTTTTPDTETPPAEETPTESEDTPAEETSDSEQGQPVIDDNLRARASIAGLTEDMINSMPRSTVEHLVRTNEAQRFAKPKEPAQLPEVPPQETDEKPSEALQAQLADIQRLVDNGDLTETAAKVFAEQAKQADSNRRAQDARLKEMSERYESDARAQQQRQDAQRAHEAGEWLKGLPEGWKNVLGDKVATEQNSQYYATQAAVGEKFKMLVEMHQQSGNPMPTTSQLLDMALPMVFPDIAKTMQTNTVAEKVKANSKHVRHQGKTRRTPKSRDPDEEIYDELEKMGMRVDRADMREAKQNADDLGRGLDQNRR